jgi:hypothetical protein
MFLFIVKPVVLCDIGWSVLILLWFLFRVKQREKIVDAGYYPADWAKYCLLHLVSISTPFFLFLSLSLALGVELRALCLLVRPLELLSQSPTPLLCPP